MLYLAHDGSLSSDWLSHYAVRFAQNLPERRICALSVRDGSLDETHLDEQLALLDRECRRADVQLSTERLQLRVSVVDTLIDRVPPGPDSYVLCGTRVKQRNFSFLRGTVSEKLLGACRFNVLVLRIVQPGLLGSVHNVLVPVVGNPRGLGSGVPFLKLLGDDVESLFVLLVYSAGGLRIPGPSSALSAGQRGQALAYIQEAQAELRRALGRRVRLDGSLVASNDPATEIVLVAKQHKSQLIYLGASERSRTERLLWGSPAEKILRHAPCDVAIYRGVP